MMPIKKGTPTTKRLMTFVVALLSVTAALALRVFWWPVLQNDSPFLFFFAAIVLSSWYGGLWPGILATVLSAFGTALLQLLPLFRDGSLSPSHAIQYAIFVSLGVLASYLMQQLHIAIDRSVRAERGLETRVQDRTAELLEANRRLHQLSVELLAVQERERLRVSRELHDELGQALTLIKMKVGLLEANLPETAQAQKLRQYCADASSHVDQAIENMRRLSRDLSPVTVETLGITRALRRLTEEFRVASGIQITASVDSVDDLLALHASILLYRIVQEGLNNIVKHSGATVARLSIERNGDTIRFELQDNGRGIDLESRKVSVDLNPGMGLQIMTERVHAMGGSLSVESRKGGGTMLAFSANGRTGTRI